jgi:type III restriction enzyme
MFAAEYAEVYGVPFSFIPSNGGVGGLKPTTIPTRVRALESRIDQAITFPRLVGYRLDMEDGKLSAQFTADSQMALSPEDLPTDTVVTGIIGEETHHYMADVHGFRENTVAFEIAREVLDRFFRDRDNNVRPWMFPQILDITKRWMRECVTLKDRAYIQLLWIQDNRSMAAEKIYNSIVQSVDREERIWPMLRPYDTVGSTRYVDFDTTKPVWQTDREKCHISHVVADTGSWEQKTAQVLEDMVEVVRYVKNEKLGFTIPYAIEGKEKQYVPDFIACIDDGHGPDNLLNLIIEVSGEARKDKAAKVATARTQWIPAVNNHGGFGRWSFLEVSDPWNTESTIQAQVEAMARKAVAAD